MSRALLDNLGWKLLSLLLAMLLWLTFASTPEVATTVAVPVEYRHIPPDLEIVSNLPERVHLHVQCAANRLDYFGGSGLAVVLDLSHVAGPGQRTFTIDDHTARLPLGVRLIRAVPAQLRVELERRAFSEVPVRVRFSGPLPHGYRIRHFEARPDKLTIVGPQSRVREADSAETDPIELAAKAGESDYRVNVFVREPQVRFVAPPLVRVKVILEPAEATSR